ncbi:MAG: Ig-like domain-containing protein [Gammaproteobacteria bacterium]|nr:Ig-like domain-containing protein [Gammaproteobacteria bacterium]
MGRSFLAVASLVLFSLLVSACGEGAPSSDGTKSKFEIKSVNPEEGSREAFEFPVDGVITATFSSAVDPETLDQYSFKIENAMNEEAVPATVEYDEETLTATLIPQGLEYAGHYKITLTEDIKSTRGSALAEPKSWEIKTVLAIGRIEFSPASGDTEVGVDTVLRVSFYAPIDENSLNDTTFKLTNIANKFLLLGGTVEYDASSYTVTFTPDEPLLPNSNYEYILSSEILGEETGMPLLPVPQIIQFSTGGGAEYDQIFGTTGEDRTAGMVSNFVEGWHFITGTTDDSFAESEGDNDVFIIAVDVATGEKLAVHQFGTPESDIATGIALDSEGNIYISGKTQGSFAEAEPPTKQRMFLAKFIFDGDKFTRVWIDERGTGNTFAQGVAIDALDDIYVLAATDEPLAEESLFGEIDLVVLKYTKDMTIEWSVPVGSTHTEMPRGIAVGDDFVYVLGDSDGDIANPFSTVSDPSPFLAQIEKEEVTLKIFPFEHSETVEAHYVNTIVASGNNVYVGATVIDSEVNSTESNSILISHIDDNGVTKDEFKIDLNGIGKVGSIAVGPGDYVFLSVWQEAENEAIPALSMKIYQFDADLRNQTWGDSAGRISGTEHIDPTTMTIDNSGNIYAAGYVHGELGGLTTKGGADAFLLKFNFNGVKQ